MTPLHDLDSETLALMRAVDPLRDPRAEEDPARSGDEALRLLLARAASEPRGLRTPPRRRRRRRAVRLGVAAAAAGVATVAVVNVASTGRGGVSTALRSSGVAVAPAHAGTLAARVRRALTGTPGGILEVKAQIAARKSAQDPLIEETLSYWDENAAPHDTVIVDTSSGHTAVTGEENGQLEYYDPAANTIGIMTPTPAIEAAEGTEPRAQAIAMLDRPGTTVDRDASFDGTPAIELTSTANGSLTTMYLARGSYTPLEVQVRPAPGAPQDEQGYSMVTRYVTYRMLVGAQATRSLVSLTAQHPSAQVVHEDPAAWNAAEGALAP